MLTKNTVIIFSDNRPGVLYRIADLFLRRKINIDSLTVSETEKTGMARFTIVVTASRDTVEKIVKQLYRIIEVSKVVDSTDAGLIHYEVALYKVHTKDAVAREEVAHLASLSKGQVVRVENDFLVVEKSGTEEEVGHLYSLFKRFGIKEFVRSGRIAIVK